MPTDAGVRPALTPGRRARRVFPLFLHDDGRCLLPTARTVWERLLAITVEQCGALTGEDAVRVWDQVRQTAGAQGQAVYEDLLRAHHLKLKQEHGKGAAGFAARRRVI